jgi:hypothetical protein
MIVSPRVAAISGSMIVDIQASVSRVSTAARAWSGYDVSKQRRHMAARSRL